MKFKIGKKPNMTTEHNKVSWKNVEKTISIKGSTNFDELVKCCQEHPYASGGEGFINYCIKNEWLIKA